MKARRIIESFENPFRMVRGDLWLIVTLICILIYPATVFHILLLGFSVSAPHWCAHQQERQIWPKFKNIWGNQTASYFRTRPHLLVCLLITVLSHISRLVKDGNCRVLNSNRRSWRPRGKPRKKQSNRRRKRQVMKPNLIWICTFGKQHCSPNLNVDFHRGEKQG